MSLDAGNQTVILVTYTEGAKDRYQIPVPVPKFTTVKHCRFRTLTMAEVVQLTDVATEIWKLTKINPPVELLNAKPDSEIQWNGKTYEIFGGVQLFPDAYGFPFKVTVMCKRQQKQIA